MLFMNTYEIDEAVQLFGGHPVLDAAAVTLRNLRDWTDRNSDGWAYWPKPCRAARRLQLLLLTGRQSYLAGRTSDVTLAQLRDALRPIKAFRTRQGADFEIVEP